MVQAVDWRTWRRVCTLSLSPVFLSLEHLSGRRAVDSITSDTIRRPVILRKDFVVHEYMIYEALAHGADTILLIVAILRKEQLIYLTKVARSLGMVCLSDTHLI